MFVFVKIGCYFFPNICNFPNKSLVCSLGFSLKKVTSSTDFYGFFRIQGIPCIIWSWFTVGARHATAFRKPCENGVWRWKGNSRCLVILQSVLLGYPRCFGHFVGRKVDEMYTPEDERLEPETTLPGRGKSSLRRPSFSRSFYVNLRVTSAMLLEICPPETKKHVTGKSPFFNRRYIFKWLFFQPVMLLFGGHGVVIFVVGGPKA